MIYDICRFEALAILHWFRFFLLIEICHLVLLLLFAHHHIVRSIRINDFELIVHNVENTNTLIIVKAFCEILFSHRHIYKSSFFTFTPETFVTVFQFPCDRKKRSENRKYICASTTNRLPIEMIMQKTIFGSDILQFRIKWTKNVNAAAKSQI